MATNPMQRKSRNSFLLGMLVTLIIAGAAIALLVLQLQKYMKADAERTKNSSKVLVLNQDVESGKTIDSSMFTEETIENKMIPSNAVGKTTFAEAQGELIAKVKLYAHTIVTGDMISSVDEPVTDDQRKQEYNVFVLPSQIATGDVVDIRLSLPSGQDYIVVSKKEVEVPEVGGIPSEGTIWIKLTEEEIVTMNNAIVDAWKIIGSKLYVTTYTEAGMQKAATPTYVPTQDVMQLIQADPNVVQTAKNELIKRYNENNSQVRSKTINPAINKNGEDGDENLKTKSEESITNSKETRKQYLESLGLTAE